MRKDRFRYALSELGRPSATLVEGPRSTEGRADIVTKKIKLDDAIKCLELCQTYNINSTARVVELLDAQAGYFEYRIMIDHESDDRKYWEELKDNQDNTITTVVGDLLVLNSGAERK